MIPRTGAGKRLLDHDIRDLVRTIRAATGVPDSQTVPGATYEHFAAAILAIEDEARALPDPTEPENTISVGPCPKCGWTPSLNTAAWLLRQHHVNVHGLPPDGAEPENPPAFSVIAGALPEKPPAIDVERLARAMARLAEVGPPAHLEVALAEEHWRSYLTEAEDTIAEYDELVGREAGA